MYAFIRGTLVTTQVTSVTLDVGGVGYLIMVPSSCLGQLPAVGQELKLFTSFVVREASQALYGFLTQNEKHLFEVLLDISGIGPKTALSVISHLSLEELHQAVRDRNASKLCKVPGIGKKTAERMLIDLEGKVGSIFEFDPSQYAAVKRREDPQEEKLKDAVSALIHLGYTQMAAQKALKKSLGELPETVELSHLISHALKNV